MNDRIGIVQDALKDVAQAASRAGKVADSAALEASQKVPATLGSEMLAGMHALVRILGESLVAGLSHEGLVSMKQVCTSLVLLRYTVYTMHMSSIVSLFV